AAEAGEPGAEREGRGERAVDVDAQAPCHALIVDCGANLRTKTRVFETRYQQQSDDERNADEEQAILAEAQAEKLDTAAQLSRSFDRLVCGAEDISGAGHRNKCEPDCEQPLVQIARPIKPAVQRAFEQYAHHRRGGEGHWQCRQEMPLKFVHQRDGDIAAEHCKSAMRQVDKVHQPEGHRQSDRQHEQQHAVGEAVEQDTENRKKHESADDLEFSPGLPRARKRTCGFRRSYKMGRSCPIAPLRSLQRTRAARYLCVGSFTFGIVSNSTLTMSLPTFSTRRM